MTRLASTVLVPALLLLASSARLEAAEVAPLQAGPDPPAVEERWVEVDGARIRARCTSGPVEAVLLHDGGGDADVWLPVLQRLEGTVGACAYDRRGHGGSGPAPDVRGWFELLEELIRVHGRLAEDRPVLVGHGLGGLYARLYAVDRPGRTGGLVLLEPVTEGALEDMRRGMPAGAWEDRMAARGRPNEDGVRLDALLRRVSNRHLPDIPVTVMTATRRPTGEGWLPRWINESSRRHQGALAAPLRRGRHLPATGSGHDIPRDAPELVAEEIVRVVRMRGR